LKRTHVTFPAGALTLEGVWHLPDGAGPFPAVIVCHPHPLYGGSMSNNIVFEICQALAGRSIVTLRFNFRGVGQSTGAYSEGTGEQADVTAALEFVTAAPGIDRDRIGLAGYSFGAGVIAPVAARDARVGRLALVSPYLSTDAWARLRGYARPKMIISGAADDVIPPEQLRREVAGMAEPLELIVVPEADHFWAGFADEVARQVTEFFTTGFRPA
jgi:uncharacterized protein